MKQKQLFLWFKKANIRNFKQTPVIDSWLLTDELEIMQKTTKRFWSGVEGFFNLFLYMSVEDEQEFVLYLDMIGVGKFEMWATIAGSGVYNFRSKTKDADIFKQLLINVQLFLNKVRQTLILCCGISLPVSRITM